MSLPMPPAARRECVRCEHAGILSGEKQRIGRSYDFTQVGPSDQPRPGPSPDRHPGPTPNPHAHAACRRWPSANPNPDPDQVAEC